MTQVDQDSNNAKDQPVADKKMGRRGFLALLAVGATGHLLGNLLGDAGNHWRDGVFLKNCNDLQYILHGFIEKPQAYYKPDDQVNADNAKLFHEQFPDLDRFLHEYINQASILYAEQGKMLPHNDWVAVANAELQKIKDGLSKRFENAVVGKPQMPDFERFISLVDAIAKEGGPAADRFRNEVKEYRDSFSHILYNNVHLLQDEREEYLDSRYRKPDALGGGRE